MVTKPPGKFLPLDSLSLPNEVALQSAIFPASQCTTGRVDLLTDDILCFGKQVQTCKTHIFTFSYPYGNKTTYSRLKYV